MADSTVTQRILQQLERLPPELQKRVYEFTLELTRFHLKGTPGVDLLSLAGTIPDDDIEAMTRAIEEDCERVNADEW